MYDNVRDARQSLQGSVCLYKGQPFSVHTVSSGGARGLSAIGILYKKDGSHEELVVKIDDPELNFMNFKLGYVNYDNTSVYLKRVPVRTVAQGLSDQNVVSDYPGMGFGYLFARKGGKMEVFSGEYPTFEQAVETLVNNRETSSIAFSRYLALNRHPRFLSLFFLEYKGKEVAYSSNGLEFSLPSEFNHLQQIMHKYGAKLSDVRAA